MQRKLLHNYLTLKNEIVTQTQSELQRLDLNMDPKSVATSHS